MDLLKINIKGNYSKIGKYTAEKYSYIFERSAHAEKILKDKPRKQIIEKSYLERVDNDNLDKSEDKDSIDIFNKDYKNKYNDLIEYQKNKYFNFQHSCALNKQFINEENKQNKEHSEYAKKYRYHLSHHNQLENQKSLNQEEEKLFFVEQNQNNDYLLHKIAYSQSFFKMVGRDDRRKLRKLIEKKLEEKRKKSENKKLNKSDNNENRNNKKIKKKQSVKGSIKGIGMDKQLQRGILPEHHDVRIRTAKGLYIESRNNDKLNRLMSSSASSSLLPNKNKFFKKNMKNDTKISRIFSSFLPKNKKDLLIKVKINKNDKIESMGKRLFSGFNSMKNITIKEHPKSSFTNKNDLIKSRTKEVNLNSDISNNDKSLSSCGFNKIKRDIYSSNKDKNSSFHKSKKNKRRRIFSTPIHNNAISFKKMLSRQYVNRIKINDKIGAGSPLTPNYNIIYPKIVMKVKYKNKGNYSKKREFKGLVGEYLQEINKKNNNSLFKYNTIQPFSNFSKMFGRGTKSDSKFPIFMNNINSRNAFDFCTEKSLQMNHFSSGKLNNPFSSFNNRKSFNNIISSENINNKNRSKNIDEISNKNNKESRLDYYNNNIENIFKKVLYDDIVDKNIDNKESNDKKNYDLLDLKKNPQLAKTINLSYKNLISDYYRLNLDYLNKDSIKEKIDGITFEIIKNKK